MIYPSLVLFLLIQFTWRQVDQLKVLSTNVGRTSQIPWPSVNTKLVEQYRKGYPRYSALLSSHNSFQLYRRFTSIRTRMLLQKQHEISLLEKELDESDENEKNPLFLSSVRRDTCILRQDIFSKLKDAMKDYGKDKASP
jgi:hypothetical protein